jgi:hypothetical protein
MNPIENNIIETIEIIGNNIIIENIENNIIIENIVNIVNVPNNLPVVLDLGPPSVLERHNPPAYFGPELIADRVIADREFSEFQCYDSPHDFVMPLPCSKCHWICCNEDCSLEQDEMPLVAKQLSFDEEMDLLPPPPPLTRIYTDAAGLLDEEWAVLPPIPPPLTRSYTNAHLFDDEELLVTLSEAALSEQLEDNEEDTDESDEFDMPEGIQYVSLTIINEDKDEDEEQEDKKQDK